MTSGRRWRASARGELIFPNPEGGIFSQNAMLAVLDRLGYAQVPCTPSTQHSQRGPRSAPLPRWRAGGSACTQVQVGNNGGLSAWSKAREAQRADERLGATLGRIKRHSLSARIRFWRLIFGASAAEDSAHRR